ncbi:hypothetical protein MBLNU230_g0041t1 [Neophaeotheca triangularis]
MRLPHSILALIALASPVLSVSLSDFTPRVQDLPDQCQKVYTQQITGCSASDFTQENCSSSCVKGLDAIAYSVEGACGSLGLSGLNTLTAFLNGEGPSSLCPNANDVLDGSGGGGSESIEAPATTAPFTSIVSSTRVASSATQSSSLMVDTTERPAIETSTAQTSVPLFSDTTMQLPSSATEFTTEAIATADSAQPTSSETLIMLDTSGPQATNTGTMEDSLSDSDSDDDSSGDSSNGNSGGGSPFDPAGSPGESSVSHSATTESTLLLGMVSFVVLAGLR